jgi:hypothetical protein
VTLQNVPKTKTPPNRIIFCASSPSSRARQIETFSFVLQSSPRGMSGWTLRVTVLAFRRSTSGLFPTMSMVTSPSRVDSATMGTPRIGIWLMTTRCHGRPRYSLTWSYDSRSRIGAIMQSMSSRKGMSDSGVWGAMTWSMMLELRENVMPLICVVAPAKIRALLRAVRRRRAVASGGILWGFGSSRMTVSSGCRG